MPRTLVRLREQQAWLPVRYPDSTQFATVHPASFDEVSRLLPSDAIRPARWLDGSALVLVAALRHRDASVQAQDGSTQVLLPYGEMLIGALVGYGRSPRALPVGRQSAFVLHMPVTTREAYDLGRIQWNFPKFVADMQFYESSRERSITLSEGGREILRMNVHPGGPVLPQHAPFDSYSAKEGKLLRTRMPFAGHTQLRLGRRSGELSLGDHEVADGLRRLKIRPEPVMSYSYLDVRFLLPAGEAVEAARLYQGFDRADRQLGSYTVAYPSTGPLDQYSGPLRVAPAPA